MSETLVSKVSQTVFGTAVAGFGFSLGRDIYRNLKKGIVYLILIVLLLGTFILPFISASKTFQWYPISLARWIFSKFILWFLVAIISVAITYFIVVILEGMELFKELTFYGYEFDEIEFAILYSIPFYFLGSLDGFRRRKRRKYIYNIEVENSHFMDDRGIVEVDGSDSFTHIDSEGNMLRLETVGRDLVAFFVVGRRGKRAFIYMDEEGRFLEYSGIISV